MITSVGSFNPKIDIPTRNDALYRKVLELYDGGQKKGIDNGYTMRQIAFHLYKNENLGKKAYRHVQIARKFWYSKGLWFACLQIENVWKHFIAKNVEEQKQILDRQKLAIIAQKRRAETKLKDMFKTALPGLEAGHERLDGNYLQLEMDLTPKLVSTMDYDDYLKTSHWQRVRKAKLDEVPQCEGCGRTVDLQVHHKYYDTIGKEAMSDLRVFCSECHGKAHNKKGKKDEMQSKDAGAVEK